MCYDPSYVGCGQVGGVLDIFSKLYGIKVNLASLGWHHFFAVHLRCLRVDTRCPLLHVSIVLVCLVSILLALFSLPFMLFLINIHQGLFS